MSKYQLGGVIHTYQKYNPLDFPSPTQPPLDLVTPAFEHLLQFGSLERLTPEQLAEMIRLDPDQIVGLVPGINYLREKLLHRKKMILQKYETNHVQTTAKKEYSILGSLLSPPQRLKSDYTEAFHEEQLNELDNLYHRTHRDERGFARGLVKLIERLGEKYQIDELASKYEFTGVQRMTVPEALEIKKELETIDRLLAQLEAAKENAQLGYIDLDELREFIDQAGLQQLEQLQQQIENYLREQARIQGLESDSRNRFMMSPRAYRLFQQKVLTRIFNDLKASRSGRHAQTVTGDGPLESPVTKPYEFGDSITHMDLPGSFTNTLIRTGPSMPIKLKIEDIVVHRTRNKPKAATCVILDMSGSMRYDAQYTNVKRMGLALDGLIRSEYPGDYLHFIEMYTVARPRAVADIASLMPKPVAIFDPIVRLRANMSDPRISEADLPPHFTNIQHGLALARKLLSVQPTPNRNIMLVTDGLPTAHYEGSMLYMLYPPDPRTEEATMREAHHCAREGITINIFLLSTWNQSEEDIRFARRLAQQTKGRVIYTAGRELDRFVIWDYIQQKKSIIS